MQIKELGHVVLYVTSLERSANFYKDTLGFKELQRMRGAAIFSSGRTHHELLLLEIGGEVPERREVRPGLYHIGFKIGDDPAALKSAVEELRAAGVRILGATDHNVTHSLYIEDSDGNELELYVDVTDAWKTDPSLLLAPPKRLDIL